MGKKLTKIGKFYDFPERLFLPNSREQNLINIPLFHAFLTEKKKLSSFLLPLATNCPPLILEIRITLSEKFKIFNNIK